MKITGICSVRNAIECGYPYIEAILSVLPLCNEFLVSDGGSEDDTEKYLRKLSETFPKVIVYQIPWFRSDYWECLDFSLNKLIKDATGDWIFEVGGDNLHHEQDIMKLGKTIEYAHENNFNSIRYLCVGHTFINIDSYIYKNVRVVRNITGLHSRWGGDDFQVGDERAPKEGFTAHNVQPELEVDIKMYHMHRLFPKNRLKADENCAIFLASKSVERMKVFETNKKVNWENYSTPKEEKVLDCLPALMKGLSQYLEYQVREELFDKNWLKKTTGLEY